MHQTKDYFDSVKIKAPKSDFVRRSLTKENRGLGILYLLIAIAGIFAYVTIFVMPELSNNAKESQAFSLSELVSRLKEHDAPKGIIELHIKQSDLHNIGVVKETTGSDVGLNKTVSRYFLLVASEDLIVVEASPYGINDNTTLFQIEDLSNEVRVAISEGEALSDGRQINSSLLPYVLNANLPHREYDLQRYIVIIATPFMLLLLAWNGLKRIRRSTLKTHPIYSLMTRLGFQTLEQLSLDISESLEAGGSNLGGVLFTDKYIVRKGSIENVIPLSEFAVVVSVVTEKESHTLYQLLLFGFASEQGLEIRLLDEAIRDKYLDYIRKYYPWVMVKGA